MEKEENGKIHTEKKGTDGAEKDIFERKYDPIQKRASYKLGFGDHCHEELSFIAGVLDLLYLVDAADQWNERREEIAFVIMEARDRAVELRDII